MLGVIVAGGTGAGRKPPLRAPHPRPWKCEWGHRNPRYATRCLTLGCAERRPG